MISGKSHPRHDMHHAPAPGAGPRDPGATGGPSRFALIIGAMKAGTTSLFEYLADHPAIAPSRPKEPDFFSQPELWRTATPPTLDAYRTHWDWDPETHRWALEASTSYTMRPEVTGVPERVKALGDREFRFVYIMRDPVERLASHLSHLATRRGGGDRVGEGDFRHALQVSRYATQLDAWAAEWPRELILPLVYEAMVDDPEATVRRVQEFLGLPPRPLDARVVRAYNVRSEMAAAQALTGLLDRLPWLHAVRRRVPGRVLRAVRGVVGRLARREIALTAAQRERAVETLRPEVERLRAEWGVDTSWWESVS